MCMSKLPVVIPCSREVCFMGLHRILAETQRVILGTQFLGRKIAVSPGTGMSNRNDGIGDHILASLQMLFQLSSNSNPTSSAADLWSKDCLKKS